MQQLHLEFSVRDWPMREPFAISRGVATEQPTLQIRLESAGGGVGRGEACGVPYAGETPASMIGQLQAVRASIEAGIDRLELQKLLPAGGARHALDAALWDLEAKGRGVSPFAMVGLEPRRIETAFTIGIRNTQAYEETARRLSSYPWLKIKVDGADPQVAVAAVRRGSPRAKFIVDPNQSWSVDQLKRLAAPMLELGVELLEQPIPVGAESALDGWTSPVPLCADELVDGVADLGKAAGRYSCVNIKLDKTGGLTSALALAAEARAQGFDLMVGCMAGSSLSMAPAMVLAQSCKYVDLDGPLLQAEDVENGLVYENGVVEKPYVPSLWG